MGSELRDGEGVGERRGKEGRRERDSAIAATAAAALKLFWANGELSHADEAFRCFKAPSLTSSYLIPNGPLEQWHNKLQFVQCQFPTWR